MTTKFMVVVCKDAPNRFELLEYDTAAERKAFREGAARGDVSTFDWPEQSGELWEHSPQHHVRIHSQLRTVI